MKRKNVILTLLGTVLMLYVTVFSVSFIVKAAGETYDPVANEWTLNDLNGGMSVTVDKYVPEDGIAGTSEALGTLPADKNNFSMTYKLRMDLQSTTWVSLRYAGMSTGNVACKGGYRLNIQPTGMVLKLSNSNADTVDTRPGKTTPGVVNRPEFPYGEEKVIRFEVTKAYTDGEYTGNHVRVWLDEVEAIDYLDTSKTELGVYFSGPYFESAEGTVTLKTITVKPCEVQYASLTLNGDIGLNFYAKLSSNETAPKADIGFADGEKTQCDGTYADGLWRFTYPVAPKDYKKAVSFALTTYNGAEVTAEYSVETYLNNVTESEAHYALCVNTKEYCEAARVYFYGETATATATLTADLSAYAGSVSGEDANVTILGATLVLETKTSVRVYFNAKNAEGLVCTVDGVTAEIKQENGFTYLEVADIAVKDLGGMHTFTIGDITVNYGAISYVQSVANVTDNAALDNVVKALYNAFVAGAEYFKAN